MEPIPAVAPPIPAPPIPAPPIDIPAPAPPVPSSGSGGGVGWFTIALLVIAIALLIAIIVIGRNIGVFRDVPKKEKETFEVMDSGPSPSCRTSDLFGLFPAL